MEGRRDESCGGGMQRGGTEGWRAVGWRTAPSCGRAAARLQGQEQRGRGAAMPGCCSPRPTPTTAPSRERPLLPVRGTGRRSRHLPCLSFPHHSTLHPHARPPAGRAARRGHHPTTNTHHPAALGPSPQASGEQSWCVPTARGWGQIRGQQEGKGLGTDRLGVQEVTGAIISLLSRRVWWLLGTAELVVAHG